MSIADLIGNAEVNQGGGTWPEPGEYLLFVDTVKAVKKYNGQDAVVAVFDVLESNCDSRRAGTRMDDGYNLSKNPEMAAGNVKAMLAAIAGMEDAKEMKPELVDKMLDETQNIAHGRLVRLSARNKQTKAGKDFTIRDYSPVPDEYQDKAQELRQQAGFSAF